MSARTVTLDKSPRRIRAMFDDISPTYDLLNHLLSLNIDIAWRRRAAELCVSPRRALDVCCGTGDLALELRRRWNATVVGSDFARRMIDIAAAKSRRVRAPLDLLQGDTTRLPFADGSFDSASVAFGIRNVGDVAAGLREMARVVRPGGRVVILEFTLPAGRILRSAYLLYFTRILPLIGSLVSGTRTNAYGYLPESVRRWPSPEAFARLMESAGLREVRWELQTFGIAAIHWGLRG